MKASDVSIDTILVIVRESDFGTRERVRCYSDENIRDYVSCSNPLCYDGGFYLEGFIRQMVSAGETHRRFENAVCRGYEGSPQGRRRYRDCLHWFKVEIKIVYKVFENVPAG
jgi:hypothetical protein